MDESKNLSFGKALLISLAVLLFIVIVIVALELSKVSNYFIFLLFLWYFATVKTFAKTELLPTFLGGLVGTFTGYLTVLCNLYINPNGIYVMLAAIIIVLALCIQKKIPLFFNDATTFMLTIMSIPSLAKMDVLPNYLIVYALSGLVFWGIAALIFKIVSKKAAAK